jgi:hypothetical protein
MIERLRISIAMLSLAACNAGGDHSVVSDSTGGESSVSTATNPGEGDDDDTGAVDSGSTTGDPGPDDLVPCTPIGEVDAPVAAGPVGSTTPRNGDAPDAVVLALGRTDTIFTPTAADPPFAGQVGRGFALDTLAADGTDLRRVFAAFSQHDDVPSAEQLGAALRSDDEGATFGNFVSGIETPPLFAVQLRDGGVLSFGFVPTERVDVGDETHLSLVGVESSDEGLTWEPFESTMIVPLMPGGFGRVSGHPIELADRTLLMPYYLVYVGDAGGARAELLASTDRGRTFVRHSTIALPPANHQYPEPDVVELRDGSLFSVFRHHVQTSPGTWELAPLLSARSTDGGLTWSAPTEVRPSFGAGAPPSRTGINPQLILMPNGALVLSSGRPDNYVAVSTAGDGVAWDLAKITYVNYPSDTTATYGSDVLRVHGSSGNTGLVVVDSNRLIQIGDNCANGWGCPPKDSDYTLDGEPRVWRRFVEVTTPDVGKIDLAGKFQRCHVNVRTDMTWTSTTHPRARASGAFDGSTDDFSSAIKADGGGYFVVELDRTYDLTRIGLAIRRGVAGRATVSTSLDGETWTPTSITNADERTHHALEYVVLPAPTPAAYVRVEVDASSECDAEIGESCSFLTELELYSTIDSFENDPIGAPPRGFVETLQAAVVAEPGASDSARVLRLADTSASVPAVVRRRFAPAAELELDFRVRPSGGSWSAPFLFTIAGTDGAGDEVLAFHFNLAIDGSIERYDPLAETWTTIAPPNTIADASWLDVAIVASTTEADLTIGGELVATVAAGVPIEALTSYAFASAGSAPVGGDFLVDDVRARN